MTRAAFASSGHAIVDLWAAALSLHERPEDALALQRAALIRRRDALPKGNRTRARLNVEIAQITHRMMQERK